MRKAFHGHFIRRADKNEIRLVSKRIEDIVASLSKGRTVRDLDRNGNVVTIYDCRLEISVRLPKDKLVEYSIGQAIVDHYGLGTDLFFRDGSYGCLNLTPFLVQGLGEGYVWPMHKPMTFRDVKLASELLDRAAKEIIETYGREFEAEVIVNENDLT